MTPSIVLSMLAQLYKTVLRKLLLKAVEDTATEWDDQILKICDFLFSAYGGADHGESKSSA